MSQNKYSSMIRPSRHFAAVEYSRSNDFPVGSITLPSGCFIGAVNVPVNRVTKHVANRTGDPNAEDTGIVTKEAPIHVSNVMLLDSDGNPTRVGYRFDEDGKKVRVSRRNGKDI